MPLHRLLCSLSSIHRSLSLIAQAKSVEEQPKIEVLPSSENEAFGSSVHLPLAEAKPRMGQENHLIPIEFQALAASAAVAVRKDDVSAAIHAAMANVAGLGSISGGGGLIQTTSG